MLFRRERHYNRLRVNETPAKLIHLEIIGTFHKTINNHAFVLHFLFRQQLTTIKIKGIIVFCIVIHPKCANLNLIHFCQRMYKISDSIQINLDGIQGAKNNFFQIGK